MAIDSDRRKHERFSVRDNAYVAVRPEFYRLGKIKDISKGGVAFEYLQPSFLDHASYASDNLKNPEIDIFLSDRKFYLSSIPCKVVYDKNLTHDDGTLDTGCQDKCCGLQFGDLNAKQVEQLMFFISNHAMSVG